MAVERSVAQQLQISSDVRAVTRPGSLFSGALVVHAGDAFAVASVAILVGFQPLASLFCLSSFVVLMLAARPSVSGDVGGELGRLLASVAAPTLLFLPLAPQGAELETLARAVPLVALAVVLGRVAAYATLKWYRVRGSLAERTLIVGEGEVASSVLDVLQRHPEYGLDPVGSLGNDTTQPKVPVLGDVDDLEDVVRAHGVRRVIIAFGNTREHALVPILRACHDLPVEVYVVPRLFELAAAPSGRNVEHVWGIPLVRLPRLAFRRVARAGKRALDVAVAGTALVVSAPVLIVAALAVRVSSHGPILFRQVRVGRHGRRFEILKFRTMQVHEDADTAWFVSADQQVTTVGRFLRRTSIDELPQLINVLRGEMSLVGPRPERPHYVDRFSGAIPSYEARHRVAGGITGWAQIHGRDRNVDSIPERARFDNDYIENWSIWRDVQILVRTLPHMFRGDLGSEETPYRSNGHADS